MTPTRRNVLLLSVLALLGATPTSTPAPARPQSAAAPQTQLARLPRPVPQIERALLISVDGCRPDLLLRARTPNIRKLIDGGSYTFWATTVPTAVTLPAHASMLTGVTPEKHGITWNNQVGEDSEVTHPKVPTIFEIAMRYGMSTAVVAGKSKFDTFARVGHVGKAWTKAASDAQVGEEAVTMLRDYRPEVMLVHFPGADKAGHSAGWASPTQVAALEAIDTQVGKILDELEDLQLRDKTVVLLTSDHG